MLCETPSKNNIFRFVKDYRYNFGIGMNSSKYLKFGVVSLAFSETSPMDCLLWAKLV